MRAAARRALESLLSSSGLPHLQRRRYGGRTLILAYHNVVPDRETGRGDAPLHVAREDFRKHLDILQETHEVVPLERLTGDGGSGEAAEAAGGADGDGGRRPRAAITFDDAYRGAVEMGVAELARRDLPATVFVAPELLGGQTFWWDELLGDLPVDDREELRRRAVEEWGGAGDRVRERAAELGVGASELGGWHRSATEEELREAAERGPISLAPHGWSHRNLAGIDPSERAEAMDRSFRWLEARYPDVLPVLAYPYGRSSPGARRAAASAGYRAAVGTASGWLGGNGDGSRFRLPRMIVPAGVSDDGFRLRTSGVITP